MQKNIPHWQMAGFVFTAVAGTLLHFLFDWTGGNIVAALFSAVNESIWEHMKLLFYPMLIFALVQWWVTGREYPAFWCVKLLGIVLGIFLIPVIYYTYTGILGTSADWFNITIFFLAAAVSFWMETKLYQNNVSCLFGGKLSLGLLCLIGLVFTVLTFFPPHIPFFQDPQTMTYGFQK